MFASFPFGAGRMFRWGKRLRDVRYLEDKLAVRNFSQRIIDIRGRFNIVVIDDKDFTPLELLRRHNYNITHLSDIPSIDSIARYPIVLCDLIGVGLALSPTMQGAQLIGEIKKSYPEKIVIAYTGGGNSALIERSITIADYYLNKDINVEEWRDTLDKAISDLANPAVVWKKVRHRLLDAGVTPHQLAILEDTFVTNVTEGREAYELALLEKSEGLDLPGNARAIIQGLVSAALFEWLKNM